MDPSSKPAGTELLSILPDGVAKDRGSERHLFDTFAGIPHRIEMDNHQVGDFGDVSLDTVRGFLPDAVFHVGVFPDTLPGDLQSIAFVHVDCDQYDSIIACINLLWPRMINGGIMLFDDSRTPGGA